MYVSSLGGNGAELFLVAVADPFEVVLFCISLVPVLLAGVVHPRVPVHTLVSRFLKNANVANRLITVPGLTGNFCQKG